MKNSEKNQENLKTENLELSPSQNNPQHWLTAKKIGVFAHSVVGLYGAYKLYSLLPPSAQREAQHAVKENLNYLAVEKIFGIAPPWKEFTSPRPKKT